jgi:uncharacterized protein
MTETSTTLHEPAGRLRDTTIDIHRALVSLQEELQAVDWYRQRVDACRDDALRAILAHNMDEEIEHAAMLLEWLRRHDAGFARRFETYLFSEGPITATEAEEETDVAAASPADDPGAAEDPGQEEREKQSNDDGEPFTVGTMKEAT